MQSVPLFRPLVFFDTLHYTSDLRNERVVKAKEKKEARLILTDESEQASSRHQPPARRRVLLLMFRCVSVYVRFDSGLIP